MSTRPCRRLPTAKLAADNADTEHKLFSSWLTLSPIPLKLLLPSPIALYCTIITFTSFAFFPFPSVASPSSTSLNLSFNSESVAITKLHDFVNETQVTLEGWVTIKFLTHIGQTCTPLHQEFILLSNVLGVPVLALVNALNNPPVSTGMESSILEPFFKFLLTSHQKGRGHMHTTSSVPIPGGVIKMWETDDKGFYDTQYMDHVITDCCGWLVTDKDSSQTSPCVGWVTIRARSVSQVVDDTEEWSWEEVTEDHGDGDLDGDNVDNNLDDNFEFLT
ncbi:hypothetical protein EDB87DRAFT_1576430 [Lactarius vividus]|nr:hypothetical protein EDB87DRAFT_1576430 [Lactarius vividus]